MQKQLCCKKNCRVFYTACFSCRGEWRLTFLCHKLQLQWCRFIMSCSCWLLFF